MSKLDIPVDVDVLREEIQKADTGITQGELVDAYARSIFADTRRRAAMFGAMGSTFRATEPGRR